MMRNGPRRSLLLSTLISSALAGVASAQVERPAANLATSVPSAAAVADGDTVAQLHVRWQVGAGAPDSLVRPADLIPVHAFEVSTRSIVRGPLVRERDPQVV